MEHKLTLLGSKTDYPTEYAPQYLEAFENKTPDRDYMVKLNCPEFTSLCPITGQPDFARIVIRYIPDRYLVESKSLKIYLFSFRNHGAFHEECVNIIMDDLVTLMSPKFIEVTGKTEDEAVAKALAAGAELRGASMYSSMEPCSHRSSEPESCSAMMLRLEFARAVFARYEPDCFVCCRGALDLRLGGVDVRVYPSLGAEVLEVNAHLFR